MGVHKIWAPTVKTLNYAVLSEYIVGGKYVVPETLFRVQEITKADILVNNSANTLSTKSEKIFSFEFSFEYVDGMEMLDLHIRTRDVNKKEISLARITDGVVSFGGQDILTVAPDTQATLRFVVDFNNGTVYFYNSELNISHSTVFSIPEGYVSAADWHGAFTNKEIVNIRAESSGTVLVHHLVIAVGNIYGD